MDYAMPLNPTPAAQCPAIAGPSASLAKAAIHDLDGQRLRILRCTAHAMASSPGGLRFKAGTRPWLVGLAASDPTCASRMKQSAHPAAA